MASPNFYQWVYNIQTHHCREKCNNSTAEITEKGKRGEGKRHSSTSKKMVQCASGRRGTQHTNQHTVSTGRVKTLVPESLPTGSQLRKKSRACLYTDLESHRTEDQLERLPSGSGLCRLCPGSQGNLVRGLGLIAKHTGFHEGEAETPA